MSFISAGALRRLAQPFIVRFWVRRGLRENSVFDVGWTRIRVRPGVFHPRYFGSSLIFARFIESLGFLR